MAAAARIIGNEMPTCTYRRRRPSGCRFCAPGLGPLLDAALPAPELAGLRAEGAARDEQVFRA
jgi:hypothetical protein